MKPATPFNESRLEMLKDPELAALYLEECLADGDIETFKAALKHVAHASLGGMSALSRVTHLNREALYRSLSEEGNPNLATLTKVLDAFGLRIGITVQAPKLRRGDLPRKDANATQVRKKRGAIDKPLGV